MKCIQCGTDNKLKDRTANQGRCSRCNHPFAFEPTTMKEVKVTDPLFAKAIADLSANNTLFFTPKQFLYFLDQRLKRKSSFSFFFIIIYLFFCFWATGFFGGFLTAISGISSFKFVLILWNILCIYYLFSESNSKKANYHSRRSHATALNILGLFILVVGGYYSFSNNSMIDYFLTLLVGLPAVWLGIVQRRRAAKISDSFLMSASVMQNWLSNWERINGQVSQLLPEPQTALPATPQNINQHPDVTAYSFDRLIVCDSDEIAQMLIANNFHFENNCAILSIKGYPPAIFDTVLQMLQRNPDLMVYAFHNASPQGVKLVHRLRNNADWFGQRNVTIIDLGLQPRQVLGASRNLPIHRTSSSAAAAERLEPEIRESLTAAELAWLEAGNFVELESFTPQQLIRILNRGIANTQALDIADPGIIIWGGDTGGLVYGVENFG